MAVTVEIEQFSFCYDEKLILKARDGLEPATAPVVRRRETLTGLEDGRIAGEAAAGEQRRGEPSLGRRTRVERLRHRAEARF